MFAGGELFGFFGAIYLVAFIVVLAIGAALGVALFNGIPWLLANVHISIGAAA